MKNAINLSELYRQARRAADDDHSGPSPSQQGTTRYRSNFISDVHLGTKDCKAQQLVQFFKHCQCEQLYLVGDIFDGWRMKSGVHWHKSFNRVIRHVLKLSKTGVPVYYITGNHNEFLRRFANSEFDNLRLSTTI